MGISRSTALEIFTNPYDLVFAVSEIDGKWAILVTRGPESSFKLLLSTESILETKEEAIDGIDKALLYVIEGSAREIADSSTLVGGMLNPEERSLSEARVLTQELRQRILNELERDGSALTYKWEPVPA